jgi:hypothetical protein
MDMATVDGFSSWFDSYHPFFDDGVSIGAASSTLMVAGDVARMSLLQTHALYAKCEWARVPHCRCSVCEVGVRLCQLSLKPSRPIEKQKQRWR